MLKFVKIVELVGIILLPSCAMRLANVGEEAGIPLKPLDRNFAQTREQRVLDGMPFEGREAKGFRVNEIEKIQGGPMGCANPLLLTGLTAGLVPGALPSYYVAKVNGEREGRRETREFEMRTTAWFSVWGFLIPESNNDKVLSRALIAAIADDRRVKRP